MTFVRRAQRVKYSDMQARRLDNEAILERLGVPSFSTLLARPSAQWLGPAARLPPSRPARAVLFGTSPARTFPSASEGAHCHRYTGLGKMVMQTLALDNWQLWSRKAQNIVVKRIKVAALGRHAPPAARARVHAHGGVALRVVAFSVQFVLGLVAPLECCPSSCSRCLQIVLRPLTCPPHRLQQRRVRLGLALTQLGCLMSVQMQFVA